MKITLTVRDVPTDESCKEIRYELRRRRIKIMDLCRKHKITDLYNQFQAWLSGNPNRIHNKKFIKVLKAEEIITEIEKQTYFR